MKHTTYSFLDLAGAIAHLKLGAYSFTGEGAGKIEIEMLTDKTEHDVAADGSVMVSKIAGNNGEVTIETQQTSNLHKWLLAWYNYLLVAPTNEWAMTSATLRNASDGTSHVITGISPTKKAGKSYQARGQNVVWKLKAASIVSVTA